jgi:putative heme-binding domain-containing protein
VTASGEFGQSFDDWGNRFTGNANTMFIHGVLPAEYLARNPNFPSPDPTERAFQGFPDIYSISQPEPWRIVRQKYWSRWVNSSTDMRASRFPANELAPRGHLTSGSGFTVYRGSAFPQNYQGNLFFGEPANNVVVRLLLEPNGVGFKPTRPDLETKREFIASTDAWFRPVNFANGPDGCLYIASMYREVIEDESAIPDDILKHLDLYSGRDRGRIFRIAPENFRPPAPPRLGKASTGELVATLARRDAWWRETAQRLLYERQDESAIEPLRRLAQTADFPQARLHALCVLLGLGALDEVSLLSAMEHPDARLREHGAKLAEERLNSPGVLRRLLALADDPDPRVRFQTAFSLFKAPDPGAVRALAQIARRDIGDKWIRSAVLTSVPTRAGALFRALLDDADFREKEDGFLGQLAQIVGARNDPGEVAVLLNALAEPVLRSSPTVQRQVLRQLSDGLARAGSSIAALIDKAPSAVSTALVKAFSDAERIALDSSMRDQDRGEAAQLLAFAPLGPAKISCEKLLGPEQPTTVQLAAVRSLAARRDGDVASLLLAHWRGYGPATRDEVLDALLRRPDRWASLLNAIESETIAPGELNQSRRQALLLSKDPSIRERAARLLGGVPNPDRQQVLQRYRAGVAKLTGDSARGALVFEQTCAVCHKHAPRENVGPRLGGLTDRSPDALLTNILDPNREVKATYVGFTLVTTDDQELTGIIANETATSVTIRRPGGAEDTVLRKNIQSLTSSKLSLMPEGLEAGLTEQQMADLITFLQKYRD